MWKRVSNLCLAVTTMRIATIKKLLLSGLVLAIAAALVVCLFVSATAVLTNRESVLMGLFVATLSILVTWIVTHLYSRTDLHAMISATKKEYADNIRTFCIKAAEKVLNLSNELTRLRLRLETTLEDAQEAATSKEASTLLQERVIATIHLVDTLKSMNDTALSDWRGVIGEELQRQEVLEKRIADFSVELANLQKKLLSPGNVEPLQGHIEQIEEQVARLSRQLPFKVSKPPDAKNREIVTVPCHECGSPNPVRVRVHQGSRKLFECISCGTHIEIRRSADGHWAILPASPFFVSTECPVCHNQIEGTIIDFPGAMKSLPCARCGSQVLVSRTRVGVNTKAKIPRSVPKQLLDAVEARLPPQPREKGIDLVICKTLGLSRRMTNRIIQALIDQGRFRPQVDGKLLEETSVPTPERDTPDAPFGKEANSGGTA